VNGDFVVDVVSEGCSDEYTWDQELWKGTKSGDVQSTLGAFAQYGRSPESLFEVYQYLGGGLQWTAPHHTRPNDIVGLGIFHINLSDKGGFERDTETTIEFFYKLQPRNWITLKIDLQYIRDPGGTKNNHALVAGVRPEISL